MNSRMVSCPLRKKTGWSLWPLHKVNSLFYVQPLNGENDATTVWFRAGTINVDSNWLKRSSFQMFLFQKQSDWMPGGAKAFWSVATVTNKHPNMIYKKRMIWLRLRIKKHVTRDSEFSIQTLSTCFCSTTQNAEKNWQMVRTIFGSHLMFIGKYLMPCVLPSWSMPSPPFTPTKRPW